jgi:hypothetical protein
VKKEAEEHSAETLQLMKNGADNEVNAVSTLVSKVLPVYFPRLYFYEEGCYSLPVNNMDLFIVSPNGSLRKRDSGNFY